MADQRQSDGARGELLASAWFLARGWLVFRNVSSHGYADLAVARRRGKSTEKYLVEVRYRDLTSAGHSRALSSEQKDLGVTICFVASDGTVNWHRKQIKENPNDGTNDIRDEQ